MTRKTQLKYNVITGVGTPCFEQIRFHPVLKQYASYCLSKLGMKVRAMTDQAIAKFGLIGPQLGMMRILRETGAISQMELGAGLGIDKATMVKLIDGIEKRGYVKRVAAPEDRRVKLVTLTPKGERTLDACTVLRIEVEDQLLARLSADEKATFLRLIGKIFA